MMGSTFAQIPLLQVEFTFQVMILIYSIMKLGYSCVFTYLLTVNTFALVF